MDGPAEAIMTYIAAKDGSRPWLMRRAFALDARLEMIVKTDAISFPSTTTGVDEIAEVLVRRFSGDYENVYTFCLSSPPKPDERRFSCDWLVGMSRRDTGDVRVGCGRYDWTFGTTKQLLVEHLKITIEVMQVLGSINQQPIMHWLSTLSYPWCPNEDAIRSMPRLNGLQDVADHLNRRVLSRPA
jgi:hypothetical protein